jgi:hypothetical protein
MEDVRVDRDEASPSNSEDNVKSRILDRIAKEVEKGKGSKSKQFQVLTGDQNAGQNPVMDTYYKGGSHVKTS